MKLGTVLVATLLVSACRGGSTTTPPVTADTWATVDGKQIGRNEVDKAYARTQSLDQQLSDEETWLAKLRVLDELITQELVIAKAPALQIAIPESELDKAVADVKGGSAAEVFQQELTKRNLTEADVREGLRRDLLVQRVMEKEVIEKAVVSDQEVTDFFNNNKAQFNLAEDSVHLAQIIVTPGPDPQIANRTGDDATTPAAAAQKVGKLMDQLKMGGNFAELARDFSEDPDSAARGGDFGVVPLSTIRQAPAPIRDAVLNMQAGNARVVNDGNVLRIVFVVSKESAGQRDLSTPGVKEQITQALKTRKEQLLRDAYLAALRTDAEITNYLARRLVQGNGKI
jgi:peptidyl-prolyl cis-trans isomerase SurA